MCVSSAFEPWHQGPSISRKRLLAYPQFPLSGSKIMPCQLFVLCHHSHQAIIAYLYCICFSFKMHYLIDFGDLAILNSCSVALWLVLEQNISHPFSLCHNVLAHQNHQREHMVVKSCGIDLCEDTGLQCDSWNKISSTLFNLSLEMLYPINSLWVSLDYCENTLLTWGLQV